MDFSSALLELKKGRKIRRAKWDDKYIELRDGIVYIVAYMFPTQKAMIDSYDLFKEDWEVLPDEKK